MPHAKHWTLYIWRSTEYLDHDQLRELDIWQSRLAMDTKYYGELARCIHSCKLISGIVSFLCGRRRRGVMIFKDKIVEHLNVRFLPFISHLYSLKDFRPIFQVSFSFCGKVVALLIERLRQVLQRNRATKRHKCFGPSTVKQCPPQMHRVTEKPTCEAVSESTRKVI